MNGALDMGLSMSELRRMPWGQLVLMMQARADQYKEHKDEPKEATFSQIAAAFGA